MPSLIDIRRRIRSVKSTQQITKAMKMVSAALCVARRNVLFRLGLTPDAARDAVERRCGGCERRGVLVPSADVSSGEPHSGDFFTSDRGLAGAFNTNLIRAAQRFADEHPQATVEFEAVGRKGRDYFRRRGMGLPASTSES